MIVRVTMVILLPPVQSDSGAFLSTDFALRNKKSTHFVRVVAMASTASPLELILKKEKQETMTGLAGRRRIRLCTSNFAQLCRHALSRPNTHCRSGGTLPPSPRPTRVILIPAHLSFFGS